MNSAVPIDLTPRLERVFDVAERQTRATIARAPDFFPMYTEQGRWTRRGELWTDWCGGFFDGIMWLLYERTGNAWLRDRAGHYARLLAPRRFDREVHDLGFIFLNSYAPWFRHTGDAALRDAMIDAGRTLALRFQPRGRYLCSFIGRDSLFIDIMMNVPIIYFAARETGDAALREVADTHCRTTERVLVRANGGTAHEGLFDTATGEFLRQSTHQGWSADSDWSRGLAWSLYGFTTVYGYTSDPADLAVARRNAEHWLTRCGDDPVPPWDFDVPAGPLRIKDSSAGAIAASGLLELARTLEKLDAEGAARYRAAAFKLLAALCGDDYLADPATGWEGVLRHGVYHYHKGLGVDESVMWGDYFLLEAVAKALGLR